MLKEIFGKKIGITQIFNSEGNVEMTTLVEIEPACILEKIDYPTKCAVRIGCFKVNENRINKVRKPIAGYFKKLGTDVYYLIREVEPAQNADFSFLSKEISPAAEGIPKEELESAKVDNAEVKDIARPKREVGVEIFKEGDIIDVRAKMKGRGFAGGMKRHGWHGGPMSHGSMSHRRIGSVGANTDPGRVVRGHRMPGHMGNVYRTVKNLKVLRVDKDKSLIFLKGAIPGSRGAIVKIIKVSG